MLTDRPPAGPRRSAQASPAGGPPAAPLIVHIVALASSLRSLDETPAAGLVAAELAGLAAELRTGKGGAA